MTDVAWFFSGAATWFIIGLIYAGYLTKKRPDMDQTIWVLILIMGPFVWPLGCVAIIFFLLFRLGEFIAEATE